MEFATLGKFCSHDMCHQKDYLPVDCSHCHATFCKNHYEVNAHDCTFDFANLNVLPTCPLCSKLIHVKVNESPDTVMNRHISTGCKTGLLETVVKSRKAAKKKRLKCGLSTCSNKDHYDTIKCDLCKSVFCLSHRHPEDHKCSNPPPKRNFSSSHKAGKKLTNGRKINNKATQLLMKLRGNRDRTSSEKKKAVINKSKAKGSKKIEEEHRIYLVVKYPTNAHRVNKDELLYKKQTMFFNKRFTVGRILDEMCTLARVENRNHLRTEQGLMLIKEVPNGDDIVFPTDIPVRLLAGQLNNKDAVTLTYSNEGPRVLPA